MQSSDSRVVWDCELVTDVEGKYGDARAAASCISSFNAARRVVKKSTFIKCANFARPSRVAAMRLFPSGRSLRMRKYTPKTSLRVSDCILSRSSWETTASASFSSLSTAFCSFSIFFCRLVLNIFFGSSPRFRFLTVVPSSFVCLSTRSEEAFTSSSVSSRRERKVFKTDSCML